MRTARLLLALFATLPLFADNWIAWHVPTRDNVRVSGSHHCISSRLVIALRMDKATIEDVRFFNPDCEPDFDGLELEMRTMTPEASIDFLASRIRTAGDPDEVVTAIALHEHDAAVPALISLARNDPSTKARRQAIFWLGQKAGEKAIGELRRSVDHDPDDDVREHAVFAISQLPKDRAVPLLIELVKTHKSAAVREKALFWLSQSGDPRALDLIESILMR